MDSDLGNRLVECGHDGIDVRFEGVLAVLPASTPLVPLGDLRDAQHREVTKMITHPPWDKRVVTDTLTNVGVSRTDVAGPDRGLFLEM